MKNKIAILGMVDICIYTIAVALYLIFKLDILLTVWEVVTFLSSLIMLLILLDILKRSNQTKSVFKTLTVVFMTGTIILTSVAHFVNVAITRKLIAEGVDIPTYFQIGYWPSVEMAVDYLAWGFFMGLAFISTACSLYTSGNAFRRLKIMLLICGSLCLLGFIGAVLINENLWYIAPLGYGVGTIVICLEMIKVMDVTQ